MTKLLVWIFLGEAALVALCVTIVAAWRSRRRRDRTFAAIAECLDRIAAQEGDRIAQHARFLQSAFHAGPDAAAEAARDLNTAKREFVRSLLTPLLTATPDFPTGLDESLNRFADGQLDIVARLMDRDSDDSDAAQAPPTQAPPAPRDTSALWEEETEPLQPAPPTPALPADAGLTAEAVIEGILPPLPAMDDSSDFFETPEPSDVAPSPTQEPAANGRTLFPSPSGTNLPGANLDSRRLALRDDSRDGFVKRWPEGPDEGERTLGSRAQSAGHGAEWSLPFAEAESTPMEEPLQSVAESGATANQQEEDSFQPPPLEEPETSADEPWAATETEASARSDEGETGEPPDDRPEQRELGTIEEQFSEMAAQAADDISSGEKAASSPIVSGPPPPIPPTDQPTKRSKPRGKKKKGAGSAEGAGDPA